MSYEHTDPKRVEYLKEYQKRFTKIGWYNGWRYSTETTKRGRFIIRQQTVGQLPRVECIDTPETIDYHFRFHPELRDLLHFGEDNRNV